MELYTSYLQLLKQFISYQSISTDKQFSPHIQETVHFLQKLFEQHGFTVQLLHGKVCNPVVFAYYQVDPHAETVLVYGHYDVQPAEGWSTDPFAVREENGRLLARGIVDNKGQIMIHIATVLDLIQRKQLKYNMKFLIEGNEETANPDMTEIVKEHKDLLMCDRILVSDGELIGEHPVQEVSLRGGVNITLRFTTAKNDLHSGIYGSAAPNALHELCDFLDDMYDDGQIDIPEWYENVDEMSDAQLENNRSLPFSLEEIAHTTGVKKLLLEEGMDFYTQTGLRPSIQVTGIKGGYIGDGYANIVPHTAEARINFRFVASQEPEKMIELFKTFVASRVPDYVEWDIPQRTESYKPVAIDVGTPFMQEVKRMLEEVYGKKVLYKNVGGGIPVVLDFKEILGVDACLVPLGNEDCNMHGKDENFRVNLIMKGLAFSTMFFTK